MKKRRNVNGNSREPDRGTWCTPPWVADLVGKHDVDAFSNPRSVIHADRHCMLERGDNGLRDHALGGYLVATIGCLVATANTRVWLQPPYTIVELAIAHYAHTRFTALLRFDPSTKWFTLLYRRTQLVCIPRRRRINFVPPPGVKASTSTFPHALFYARAEDATPAVLRACIAWKPR